MSNQYFIMILNPNGIGASPIIDDDGIMIFSSRQEAEELAGDHSACQAFGYRIFDLRSDVP